MIITRRRIRKAHKKLISGLETALLSIWENENGYISLPATFWQVAALGTKYINSVQNVSITIASGATTGTASVSAAVGTFFPMYQGNTTSATTSGAQSFAMITISGTTVTATRTTSSTNTCTVNAIIVDATANLVTSVQTGTIAVTSGTSGTATISAVTLANSVVYLCGNTSGSTTFNDGRNSPTLVLTNTTTVTSTVRTLSVSCTASFVVINFNASALNQAKQAFSKSWTNSAISSTQTITSVNVNNAMLFFAGCDNDANETNTTDRQTALITSATVVTVTTGVANSDAAIVCNFSVVEFVSGVLSQVAQRGTIATAAATSNTATITSASVTKTILNYTGFRSATTAVTTYATILPRITQTSVTVVTENLNSAGSVTVAYEALTFN